ncbi:MAG: hypothetical protein AB2L14_23315 [Candidatus Xenobiia bacterium LiM19]
MKFVFLFICLAVILSLPAQLCGCASREEKLQRYEQLVEQKSKELQPVIEQKASEVKYTPGMSQQEYNRQIDQKAKELEPYYEQKAGEIQREMKY